MEPQENRVLVVDRRVNSEQLTLGHGDASDAIQRAELFDCKLRFENPKNIIVYSSRFTRCTIMLGKQCRERSWRSCDFTDCTFSGRFFGCNFGTEGADVSHLEGYGTLIVARNVQAHLANCDFSQCEMHLCTFFNCDPSTIKFPGWPHIVVLYPCRNAEDWRQLPFPKAFAPTQNTIEIYGGFDNVASIINWKTWAKQNGQ
jgi:hypothetical protein